MRVSVESDHPCRSSTRISDALKAVSPPGVEVVHENDADLVMIHVGGRFGKVRSKVNSLVSRGKKYVILQLVIRACTHPNTADWLPFWSGAELVWSYYDLDALMHEDGNRPPGIRFFQSSLGVDRTVFYPRGGEKKWLVVAEGDNIRRESMHHLSRACADLGKRMLHIGPPLDLGSHVDHVTGVSDDRLAELYSQCEFASGLRTIEGFELTAAEGLMCGARPILYDRPDHRQWYGPHAVYVRKAEYIRDMLSVRRPVELEEILAAGLVMDWNTMATGIWDRIYHA